MKRSTISLLLVAAVTLGTLSFAQDVQVVVTIPSDGRILVPEKLPPPDLTKAFSFHPRSLSKLSDAQIEQLVAPSGLPLWTYSIVAPDRKKPYSGYMVGTSPYASRKTSTSIPTIMIALKFSFLDASGNVAYVFDANAADSCAGGRSTVDLVNNSPILNSSPYTMNGVNVGTTQYADAFQRANFWQLVLGSNYHVYLNPSSSVNVDVVVPSGHWGVGQGSCSLLGTMDMHEWDTLVQNTLLGLVGATPNQLALFYTQNVGFTFNGACCVLGYHSATGTGQTYSVAEFETSGYYPPAYADTAILSHEVAEWMDDPLTNNLTPAWGHIGQVLGCQSNLEVADSFSGTNFNPTGVFMNGYTYHLQELAFYSWFFSGASTGSGGKYSNNQDPTLSFQGWAKPCPPGGTN